MKCSTRKTCPVPILPQLTGMHLLTNYTNTKARINRPLRNKIRVQKFYNAPEYHRKSNQSRYKDGKCMQNYHDDCIWTEMKSKGNMSRSGITSVDGKKKLQKGMTPSCCPFDQAT